MQDQSEAAHRPAAARDEGPAVGIEVEKERDFRVGKRIRDRLDAEIPLPPALHRHVLSGREVTESHRLRL
jgi:hypothetical protein